MTHADAQIVAEASGVRLVASGQRLLLVDVGGGGPAVARFVLALVAVITGINALVLLGLGIAGGGEIWIGGLALAVVATGAAFAWARVLRASRRREARPPDQLPRIATFDLGAQALLDANDRRLAALADVTLTRAFQLGSSSPALDARFPGGCVRLVRGSPFAGGIASIESALRSHGVRTQRG